MIKSALELSALDTILDNYEIPPALAFEVELQRCIAKYHDSLSGDAESSVRDTLVELGEQELDDLVSKYRTSVTALLTLDFHTAQLHLYTLALIKEKQLPSLNNRRAGGGQVAKYRQLGMTAASRLIDIYCEELRSPDSRLTNFYRALPKSYSRSALDASFFLLRYFVLNPACPSDQKTAARSKVLMVYAKLQEISTHQFAEAGRAAAVIEVLCRHGEAGTSNPPEDIDDRGVASVTWSTLIAAANLRGKRNLRSKWLEKINPSSPALVSDQPTSSSVDAQFPDQPPADFDYPLPDNIWDQSFLQMLDFNAYDIEEAST